MVCRHVRPETFGDARRRRLHRVARKVGVARCRLHFAMAEQLADHRQALAERERMELSSIRVKK